MCPRNAITCSIAGFKWAAHPNQNSAQLLSIKGHFIQTAKTYIFSLNCLNNFNFICQIFHIPNALPHYIILMGTISHQKIPKLGSSGYSSSKTANLRGSLDVFFLSKLHSCFYFFEPQKLGRANFWCSWSPSSKMCENNCSCVNLPRR